MLVIRKSLVALAAAAVRFVAGTDSATPLLAFLNAAATDDPIFPVPLIALTFLALPISGLLFPLRLG